MGYLIGRTLLYDYRTKIIICMARRRFYLFLDTLSRYIDI